MNFRQYPNITSVVIPKGVVFKNDMPNAFRNMRNLSTFQIDENSLANVKNMDYAFENCVNLNSAPVCGNYV